MEQVAHIRYEGGGLLLPAQDPYDRELVFEEAECRARRHGAASVQFGRKEMSISIAAPREGVACADCEEPLGLLIFIIDRSRVCQRCAKRQTAC